MAEKLLSMSEFCFRLGMAKQEYQERFFSITIYESPSDMIGYFVARIMLLENGQVKPTSLFYRANTLAAIFSVIPEQHFEWFERSAQDDPVIVGSYF